MAGAFSRKIDANWLFLTHFSGRYGGTVSSEPTNERVPFTKVHIFGDIQGSWSCADEDTFQVSLARPEQRFAWELLARSLPSLPHIQL